MALYTGYESGTGWIKESISTYWASQYESDEGVESPLRISHPKPTRGLSRRCHRLTQSHSQIFGVLVGCGTVSGRIQHDRERRLGGQGPTPESGISVQYQGPT